jgi:hypothetical protein
MAKGPTLTVTLMTDDKMTKGLQGATASVEGFGKKISGFAVGAGAALTTMAITAIPQVVDLAGQMVGLGQQAELYATKSKTVFGSNAGNIKKWADSVNESFGLSDEKVVGLAASFGDLMVPLGFTREQAAKMSKETIGLSGALSAWSGGQYDAAEVSDILAKAMLGERDGLKALGISVSDAEVEQRALELAMKDGRDEVTAMDKALASQQLIMEKSADAQKAWADGSMDAVKSQNEMKASIEDAKTAIGTALLPMMQSATKWIVETFIPAVKDLVATFQEKWPEIKAAIEPTLTWIVETVTAVIEFVQALWEQFGDRILTHAQNTWKFIREAIESAMQIIKGVIDVVTGIISGDWGKAWDGIKAIVDGVWDGITNLIRYSLQIIGSMLDIAWENIKGAASAMWGALAAYIDDTWEKIKGGVKAGIDAVVGFITGLPGRVASAVGDGFEALWDKFRGVINKIIGAWNDLSFKFPQWDGDWNGPLPGGGFTVGGWTVNSPNIPTLAAGGIVPATPGGRLALIGEGGQDEAVIPLNKLGRMGGDMYFTINGATDPDAVVRAIRQHVKRNGPLQGIT